MRTNSKTVRTKVKKHIFEFLEEYESIVNVMEDLKAGYGPRKAGTWYRMAQEFINTGGFLIYYEDISDIVAEWTGRKADKNGKEYSESKSWELYKHLISLELEKMINKYAKDGTDPFKNKESQ